MLAPTWYKESEITPRQAIDTLVDMACEYYPDLANQYTAALIELNRNPENIPNFCDALDKTLGDFLRSAIEIADAQINISPCEELKTERAIVVSEAKKLQTMINVAQGIDRKHAPEPTEYDALLAILRCG